MGFSADTPSRQSRGVAYPTARGSFLPWRPRDPPSFGLGVIQVLASDDGSCLTVVSIWCGFPERGKRTGEDEPILRKRQDV